MSTTYQYCAKCKTELEKYKDGEFHPEYRDKMVENIDVAMNIEDSTY